MDNEIGAFSHCPQCLDERPDDVSPAGWARFAVGWTPRGVQVWCERHNRNVTHLDFESRKFALAAAAPVQH